MPTVIAAPEEGTAAAAADAGVEDGGVIAEGEFFVDAPDNDNDAAMDTKNDDPPVEGDVADDLLGRTTTTTTTTNATAGGGEENDAAATSADRPKPPPEPSPAIAGTTTAATTKPPPPIGGGGGGGYIAVRVGRASFPPRENDDDDGDGLPPPATVAIRSAIFLSWDDARSFVELASPASAATSAVEGLVGATAAAHTSNDNVGDVVEYRRFDDIEKAERYLRRAMPGYDAAAETKRRKILLRKKLKKKKMLASKKGTGKVAHKAGGAGATVGSSWSLAKMKSIARRAASLPHHHPQAYPPPKNFNPPTRKWNAMYDAALRYRADHGDLDVPAAAEDGGVDGGGGEHADLAKWIRYQRTSYRYYLEDPLGGRHSMTEDKVNRLSAAGFAWIVDDRVAWLAEEGDAGGSAPGAAAAAGKKKRGRPRKTARMRLEEDLEAAAVARGGMMATMMSYPVGGVEGEGGGEGEDASSSPRPIRPKWLASYEKLKEYRDAHGTIEIGPDETDEELSNLRLWLKNQRNMHVRWRQGHDVGMTKEKEDMLKELGMEFAPSWEDMYAKVVQHKAQNGGSIDGITSESDPILAAWMARQNDVLGRHLQGKSTRLSDDQAMRLLSSGFQGGGRGSYASSATAAVAGKTVASRDFDARWNEMWLKLKDYKAENGHCNVPTSSSNELALWVAAQRRMYNKLVAGKPGKRASLDAVKMQRLTELGFAFRPRGSYAAWDDQMKGLWDFKASNGHCRVPVNHPTLGSFVKLVRRDYKNWQQGKPSSMTPEREAALKEVGFTFEGGKTPQRADVPIKTWDERLDELLQYKAECGHTVVPQNSGQLGAWVHSQRVHYKKYKNGQKSQMTAEKALRLTEIGFCFNASDRYRGNKRHRTAEQQEEEEAQLQQQLQQQQQHQQGYQQIHPLQETVQVPQGFQAYM